MENLVYSNLKITIGVCVKNCGNIIGEAVDSIIDQDFPHALMEVIFVDDGSEDDTLQAIQSYLPKLDMQVKIFHHEWRGLGATRNIVVNSAGGDYIVWVDGDMKLPKDFVRKQLEFMERNHLTGIGKAKYGLTSQANLVSDLENMEFATTNLRQKGRANSTPLGAGGSIYRVKAIRQVNGFDENIKGSGEDMDVEQRISAAGWLLDISSAFFYEKRRKTWKSLWSEYFWHGKGNSDLFRMHNKSFNQYKLLLPVVVGVEATRVVAAYKLTRRKAALLLPFHFAFKRAAWFLGFLQGLLENEHGHK